MANSVLPYWDQNIDLDIAPWVPYGKDYSPVTVNSLCNPTLGGLAGLALEMKSEFLYMRSFQNGSIGTMARQNIIDPVRNSSIELGFTMVFAYSEQLEQSVLRLLHKYPGLMAGLTLCDIWRENVLVDECKVLMLVDEDPFFNETDFIEALYKTFQSAAGRANSNLSFFAEKFGKKLTDSMVRRALEGKRPKVSGLKSKAGKTFDARLVPDRQYGIGLSFDDLNRKKK